MTKQEQIEKLEIAEAIFIASMDGLPTYSEFIKSYGDTHYRLIEGVFKGKEQSVSFFYDERKNKAYVVVNRAFPKHPQAISVIQFYEWMDKPDNIMMQDQRFELSGTLRNKIKEHFKTLRNEKI